MTTRSVGKWSRGSAIATVATFTLIFSSPSVAPLRAVSPRVVQSSGAVQARGLKVLGHLDLGEEVRFGDVFFFDHGPHAGPFAYLGTSPNFELDRPCGQGVKIVDVSRPARPRLVATAAGMGPDVDYEDVSVAHIGTRDVLAVGIQSCTGEGRHGLALYDVTDPTAPRKLSFLSTPPIGIHELDLVVRPDGRALVLATVPHSEREGTGGDVRIIEVTHPKHPVELADWGILRDSSLPVVGGDFEITDQDAGIGAYASNLAHGVRAADGGMTLYVSHWDAGVIKLDISDPAHPRLLGRTTFDITEDGDAHSAALYDANGARYILQNNEEISPLSPPVITSSATGARQLPGLENHFMPTPLSSIGVTTGEAFDANDACERSDFHGADGKIALFDTGQGVRCDLGGQVVRAIRSSAQGFLINFLGTSRPTFFRLFPDPESESIISREGTDIPSAMFSEIDGGAAAMRAQLATGPVTVTMTPTEPSLGFLEVFSEANPASRGGVLEYRQVGEFSALPHVVGDPKFRRGWFTIHNTETMGQRAYSSWYAHGIVALDISDPTSPALVGKFTPRVDGPAEMWGVALDGERTLVFGSDIRSGLWILRPTRAAAQ
jgi:hypothetical protein